MNKGYIYDQISDVVTMSSVFAKKASQVGTKEYNIIRKLKKDHPNVSFKTQAEKQHTGLTYKKMRIHISQSKDVDGRDAEEMLPEFERQCKLSHVQPMPYRFVMNWFFTHYPDYSEPVYESKDDMDKPSGNPESDNEETIVINLEQIGA